MQTIHLETKIAAPIERCFLLSTHVELVQQTLGMKLIEGTTSGHIVDGSRVVWRGWKFCLPTQHHTRITGYAEPRSAATAGDLHADFTGQRIAWFQDSQERGRFVFFTHDHYLRESRNGTGEPETVLEDVVRFSLPLGILGRMVSHSIVAPHIRSLVTKRFALLKHVAESNAWKHYLKDGATHGNCI